MASLRREPMACRNVSRPSGVRVISTCGAPGRRAFFLFRVRFFPLLRIHPNHYCRHDQPFPGTKMTVAGMPYCRTCWLRASFEPHHGEEPTSWHVVKKPD